MEEPPNFDVRLDFEYVVDWEDRIAKYPQDIKQVYYTAFEKLKEADEMFVDKSLPWTVYNDVKKKG